MNTDFWRAWCMVSEDEDWIYKVGTFEVTSTPILVVPALGGVHEASALPLSSCTQTTWKPWGSRVKAERGPS